MIYRSDFSCLKYWWKVEWCIGLLILIPSYERRRVCKFIKSRAVKRGSSAFQIVLGLKTRLLFDLFSADFLSECWHCKMRIDCSHLYNRNKDARIFLILSWLHLVSIIRVVFFLLTCLVDQIYGGQIFTVEKCSGMPGYETFNCDSKFSVVTLQRDEMIIIDDETSP